MTPVITAVLLLLAGFLALGVWVSFSLFAVGIGALTIFRDMPVGRVLSQSFWNSTTGTELLALPLFILMAEILFRTKLAEKLFAGLAPWTASLPGGMAHVNVLGCSLFAAVSGSSAATTVTVGRITLKELLARGYDKRLLMGSLAGAGTLGFLIPPSVIMIIYGVLAEQSILRLFLAGLVPGVALALCYMIYIGVWSKLRADLVPVETRVFTWRDRIAGLLELLPVFLLITFVLGSMYGGIASPTEGAAIGVLGAIIVSIAQRTFSPATLWEALMASVRTTSMIGLIIAGAVFLSVAMGYLGIPRFVASTVAGMDLSPLMLILMLLLIYVLLGCVLEGLSIIVMTLPITLPLIVAAGFDPIWFGVFLILVVELAQITPPVGFNLFVIQSITGEKLSRIAYATVPFFLITLAFTIFIIFVPQLALFLPENVSLRR
ncbi:TRAP transporter large permease subunit [Saliniramus sp.]|uniref:TRAP transporter large permease n=1 Tax=Saliniramus sp. TaxID=2986772 RepID=UPI002BBC75DB|nr:TRAP transporter large permease subunit [Saliniramus sp.]HMB09286.1 TRAP transporter large permease subunit [Saliniramus sp.]